MGEESFDPIDIAYCIENYRALLVYHDSHRLSMISAYVSKNETFVPESCPYHRKGLATDMDCLENNC